jgi:hypothetical protein
LMNKSREVSALCTLEPKKRGKLFFFASILLAEQWSFTASTWLHFLHGKIDAASSIIQLQF